MELPWRVPNRVRMRRARIEHLLSACHPIATAERTSRIGRFVPTRPLRHLPFLPARRRQRPSSHPSPRCAASRTANRLAQRAARSFTPTCSPWICGKPIAATAPLQPHQAQPRRQIPIAPAAPPGAPLPAISCLGAFPTPAAGAHGWHRHRRRPKTCTISDIRTAAEKLAIRSRRRRERAAWAAL
jgi:hypothetical protein